MAAALRPNTRRAAADGGELWTHWLLPRYLERGLDVEGGVCAMKPVVEEGEEEPQEQWVVRLTTFRDLRRGRARRVDGAMHAELPARRRASSPISTSNRQKNVVEHGRAGRKALPGNGMCNNSKGSDRWEDGKHGGGKVARGTRKKAYFYRNNFDRLISDMDDGVNDAYEEILEEGDTFADPELDTKPQRQTSQEFIEDQETFLLDATKPTQMHTKLVGEGEMFGKGELVGEGELVVEGDPKRLERRMGCYFAQNEEELPALVKIAQGCVTEKREKTMLEHVQGPGSAKAAGGEAASNPFLGTTRRAYRRHTRGGGGGAGAGRDGGGGRGQGNGFGGGGGYWNVGPDKTPVPRARCQVIHCDNFAKRYCSGCHSIYCDGCGCGCDSKYLNYVLPEPILVGDCEIHHVLADPFPGHPFILVIGVRSLLYDWVDYTFASVHEIFRIEDIEPDIPVLRCRLTDQGPFSWVANPLVLVPGSVARTDLFR